MTAFIFGVLLLAFIFARACCPHVEFWVNDELAYIFAKPYCSHVEFWVNNEL